MIPDPFILQLVIWKIHSGKTEVGEPGSILHGGNRMVWTGRIWPCERLRNWHRLLNPLAQDWGLGVRRPWELGHWTLVVLEQGLERGFGAEGEGDNVVSCLSIAHPLSPWHEQSACQVAVWGECQSELSCASVEAADVMHSEQASYSAQADPLNSWHVAYICFVTFERQTTAERVKRWLPVLRATLSSTAASQLPASMIYGSGERGRGGTGAMKQHPAGTCQQSTQRWCAVLGNAERLEGRVGTALLFPGTWKLTAGSTASLYSLWALPYTVPLPSFHLFIHRGLLITSTSLPQTSPAMRPVTISNVPWKDGRVVRGLTHPGFLFVHKFPVMRLFVLKSGMSLKAAAVEVEQPG